MTETWANMKTIITTRLREPALAAIAGKLDIPRFYDADLDQIMLRCARELCREIPDNLTHSIGAAMHTVLTSSTGSVALTPDVVKIQAVTIDNAPAKMMPSVSAYVQKKRASATQAIYVFLSDYAGTGYLSYAGGTNLRAVAIIEPDLSVFQSDAPTLPPSYSDLLIQRALERISLITSG